MADRKAELERKKAKLEAMRAEKKRKDEVRRKQQVGVILILTAEIFYLFKSSMLLHSVILLNTESQIL